MEAMPTVPDLSDVRWDLGPVGAPGVVVVVPARNEAETIGPAMETLLAQDYPWLRIVAVDDRSTDGTGELLEQMAARRQDRLGVIHLTEEAEGWISKTFAMEAAARQSRSEWLLFTDADVWLSPSILRRAVTFGEISRADHVVVMPSVVVESWSGSAVDAFLSVSGLWLSRPWRVADPKATWDVVGEGAFNLIRRDAWEELGGFAPQRLALVDDVTMGRRVRAAGMRQRLVLAPGLVLVQGRAGIRGMAQGMTKKLFAAVGLRVWMATLFVLLIGVLFLLPATGLGWPRTLLPCAITLACIGAQYRTMSEVTGVQARWAWMYPLGAVALIWAMARSVAVTTARGGVRWRDTFYPLRELSGHNSPFVWEFEAARLRSERRRSERGRRRGGWLRMTDRIRRGRKATR